MTNSKKWLKIIPPSPLISNMSYKVLVLKIKQNSNKILGIVLRHGSYMENGT
jgi:hypothetical protein